MALSREERETVICWTQADGPVSIYTHDRALIRDLEKRGLVADREYPHEGAIVAKHFDVPKELFSVRIKPQRTERQRLASIALGKRRAEVQKPNKLVADSDLTGPTLYPNPSGRSKP